jgi:hypothetical protein
MVKSHEKNQGLRRRCGVPLLLRLFPCALSRHHRFFLSRLDGLPGSGRDFGFHREISVAPVPPGAGGGAVRRLLSLCRCTVYLLAVADSLSIGGACDRRL